MNELIVIAGIVLMAIAIIGGLTGQFNIPQLSRGQRSALGILGIIVLLIGVWPPPNNTPEPIPTPSPTPTLTPSPTPTYIIDPMESTVRWDKCRDDEGSSMNIKSILGRTDKGIEISYDLKKLGWVQISKKINPEILYEYEGIKFYYKGSGEPNTIELKLIHEDTINTTTYGVMWHNATVTDDWVVLETPYSEIDCWWPEDNCIHYGNKLDLEKVRKIEFVISNKPNDGDAYGSGWVIIDDVQGIAP